MSPRLRLPLRVRLAAFLQGIDLATNAPVNGKGGRLRALVQKLARGPVYGMEIIEGNWWAHTERGWHPVSWYCSQAFQEQDSITLTSRELARMKGHRIGWYPLSLAPLPWYTALQQKAEQP